MFGSLPLERYRQQGVKAHCPEDNAFHIERVNQDCVRNAARLNGKLSIVGQDLPVIHVNARQYPDEKLTRDFSAAQPYDRVG